MSSPRSDAQDPGAAPGGDLDALAEAAGVERIPADRVDPDRGGRLGQGAPGREVAADAPDSEWYGSGQWRELGLPAPVRRLLETLETHSSGNSDVP